MSSLKTQKIRPQVLELLKQNNPNLEIWWDAKGFSMNEIEASGAQN